MGAGGAAAAGAGRLNEPKVESSGVGTVVRALAPRARVVGVQVESCAAVAASLAAGHAVVAEPGPPSIADGSRL